MQPDDNGKVKKQNNTEKTDMCPVQAKNTEKQTREHSRVILNFQVNKVIQKRGPRVRELLLLSR